ncbi:MEDS domain-containing protein [Clostridium vincentii]|uniref:Spo0E like sporulation regulatory protein n=1 Tax=Clostridium vincentii TaxID=52704 RepID=A0A2T0BDQ4_9CLOT|nr:MEDS domain-containing protein [Clostridium vincentii]PRR81995.1 Spo0E like sporulation regulatory protein [Clostridium vincentii]
MSILCINCNLNSSIEEYREHLNNIIVKKNHNLLDDEVITLSQALDDLVYKCIFCNRIIKNVSKLDLKNIFGRHTSLYYYGEEHLFINLYFYIKAGIENNELIYLAMEENIYNKLLCFLRINNIETEHIKLSIAKGLIKINKDSGLTGLKEQINKMGLDNEVKKHNGVRWIGQSSYSIENNSQEDFLDYEKNLSKALNNVNASVLCIYDAYDYMHEGKVINKTVMEESLETHSYILKNLELEGIH